MINGYAPKLGDYSSLVNTLMCDHDGRSTRVQMCSAVTRASRERQWYIYEHGKVVSKWLKQLSNNNFLVFTITRESVWGLASQHPPTWHLFLSLYLDSGVTGLWNLTVIGRQFWNSKRSNVRSFQQTWLENNPRHEFSSLLHSSPRRRQLMSFFYHSPYYTNVYIYLDIHRK